MIRERAEPSLIKILMIETLEEWTDELNNLDLVGHAQFDTGTRLNAILFLVCERMRHDAGLSEPLVPFEVRFTDWLAAPALEFLYAPSLVRSRSWLIRRGLIKASRKSLNFSVTADGRRAVDRHHTILETRTPLDMAETINEQDIRDNAIDAVISEVAALKTDDFRDYLLSYAFRLYNEDVAHSWVDFDERYKLADSSARRDRDMRASTYRLY